MADWLKLAGEAAKGYFASRASGRAADNTAAAGAANTEQANLDRMRRLSVANSLMEMAAANPAVYGKYLKQGMFGELPGKLTLGPTAEETALAAKGAQDQKKKGGFFSRLGQRLKTTLNPVKAIKALPKVVKGFVGGLLTTGNPYAAIGFAAKAHHDWVSEDMDKEWLKKHPQEAAAMASVNGTGPTNYRAGVSLLDRPAPRPQSASGLEGAGVGLANYFSNRDPNAGKEEADREAERRARLGYFGANTSGASSGGYDEEAGYGD